VTGARLLSVAIEGFRGFAARQVVDLDADVVLIHGDNGTGKTSITEAIAWGLCGVLPQELVDRAKGSRPIRDLVANAYARTPPSVELRFAVDGGTVEVVRRGNAKSSDVEVVADGSRASGDSAVAAAFGCETAADLIDALTTSALLRQDAIRAAIDVGPAALHERMAGIVGLDEITRFTSAAKEAVKEARAVERGRKQELESAISRLQQLTNELAGDASAPVLDETALTRAALAEEMLDQHRGGPYLPLEGVETLEDLASATRSLAALIDVLDRGATRFEQAVQSASEAGAPPEEIRPRVEVAEAHAESMEQMASTTQRLNQSALELLGDHCPVCRQPVDEDALRRRLTADIAGAAQDLRAAREARDVAASLRAELEAALRHEAAVSSQHAAVSQAGSQVQAAAASAGISIPSEMLEPKHWRFLASRLSEIHASLRRAHASVHEQVAADLSLVRDRAAAARAAVETATAELQLAQARVRRIVALSDAAQLGADQIVASWLEGLAPSFSEVFDRLQPHPTFTDLRFKPDVFYKKNVLVPEVVDSAHDVVANPLVTFSEGQLNAVALSYFLGMALNAPSTPLSFLLLDDPLQSMDVISALGFADLCRRLRSERQLILTTHDRRWAELLVRKLRPRVPGTRSRVIELEGWTRTGPVIRTSVVEANERSIGTSLRAN
jgi:DNA repair exonuclease SbcCD ATPase subunit